MTFFIFLLFFLTSYTATRLYSTAHERPTLDLVPPLTAGASFLFFRSGRQTGKAGASFFFFLSLFFRYDAIYSLLVTTRSQIFRVECEVQSTEVHDVSEYAASVLQGACGLFCLLLRPSARPSVSLSVRRRSDVKQVIVQQSVSYCSGSIMTWHGMI